MKRILLSTTLTLAAATPVTLHAQDDARNRFYLGPSFGLNFKADFHNNSTGPGPATGGANHTYNDGYVLLDSSGDAGGLTWNWGYNNAAQVVGNAMQFHSIQPDGSASATGNPQYGGELIYQRVLGYFSGQSSSCYGLEAGFGFTDINLRKNENGTAQVTTDSYSLNGVTPPGAGYNGTFQGPGALLGDTPTRTSAAATLTGQEKLTGQLFNLRLGPFAEWHFTSKLSLAASVGLTLAPATIKYDFSETATVAGSGAFAASGHSSKTELLYGPYVEGMLRYDFNKSWGAFVGVQFQSLTHLDQSIGSRTARFDPGATFSPTAGICWKF
jgi:hypothetical protein